MGSPVADRMKNTWNALARQNAMHFIATEREDWDTESFLRSGRETVRRLFGMVGVSAEKRTGVALDLGCGVGRLSFALADIFSEVIGVDISEEMIEKANALKEELGCQNVEFYSSNGSDIRFVPDSSLDLALSYIVLQHIPDRRIVVGYIQEMARVVKFHGHMLFQVPIYQTGSLVYIWRFAQKLFRFFLWNVEALGLIAPEKRVGFRGTRLSMEELRGALHESGMEIVVIRRYTSTYRLCDDITLYCKKIV